jgi:hypothetical protein
MQGYVHMITLNQLGARSLDPLGPVPDEDIARARHGCSDDRTGMANLAALLMAMALPYDS